MRAAVLSALLAVMAGCSSDGPPPRASIPPVGTYTLTPDLPAKPLPGSEPVVVAQPLPEQQAFVETYQRVGRPRIMLFVNRTLSGQIVPTSAAAASSLQRSLAPGEYDELSARRVDYDAVEHVLGDSLAANGQVPLVWPKLSEGQVLTLEQGKPEALADLSKTNEIDVLVQVQATPTRLTAQGLAIRLTGEAMNTRGGESLARASVDVPPPLDRETISDAARGLARNLLSDITKAWSSPRPPMPTASTAPPTTQP